MAGRHILYIINPVAGKGHQSGLHQLIEERTRQQAIACTLIPSSADGDYGGVRSMVREYGITDIVIAGGDGTVNQVMGSLIAEDIRFGIVPCGSGNGLAFGAGVPKDPEAALRVIFRGNETAIDCFYVNQRFACMLCGLGFDAQVAHAFAQQKTRGLATYVKQAARHFFSARPYPFDIRLPGYEFSVNAYFISIANSNQFGNHFTIAPRASLSDGLLDIVIMTDQRKWILPYRVWRQIRGKNPLQTGQIDVDKKGVIYFQTDRLSIGNTANAPLHIDGDPAVTAPEISIKIEKQRIRFLQP